MPSLSVRVTVALMSTDVPGAGDVRASFIALPFESLENAVRQLFRRKGEEVVDLNLKALRAGREAATR